MSCIQFEEIVHDLDRPGTAGAALREAALAHAESCAHCAQLLTETESLDQALETIATADGKQSGPAWMEASLLEEFRRANANSAAGKSWSGRRLAALAIAAAVLLAAAASLFRFAPGVKKTTLATTPSEETSQTQGVESAAESGSDFIALPYADDPDGVEGGAVVRVQLSGSALASLGVPVSLTGSSTTVSADLLVSDDGTPQAIRLVSQEETGQAF